MAKKPQALISIDVPSILETSIQDRQALKDAFHAELVDVLTHDRGAAFDDSWNIGRVATEVVVVAGKGSTHATRRKPTKKTAKKSAKKAAKKSAKKSAKK